MVAGVIVTHGQLAQALLDTARLIVGDLPLVQAVCLEPWDGGEVCSAKVHRAIDAVDQGDGVLVLADLPGGTPCNVGIGCLEDRKVEVVTGVNVSMLVKLRGLQLAGADLLEAAHQVAIHGASSVRVMSEEVRARAEAQAQAAAAGSGEPGR